MDIELRDGGVVGDERGRGRAGGRWLQRSVALGLLTALLAGMLPIADAQAGSGRLYRYTNEQGRVEITDAVPANRAAGGYQVLDAATGRVLETVAAQLSPAEQAAKQARDQAREACQQDLERIRTLYTSVREIDQAEQDVQSGLENRIANLQASRALEERRLEQQEQTAAQRERSGRTVTPELHADIERSRSRISAIDAEIEQRRGEQSTAKQRFAAERAQFESGQCDPGEPSSADR